MSIRRGPSSAPTREEVVFEQGSGNVFADLGLPDAEELQAKADLVHVIINIVEDKGWKQKKAASVLGIAESEMSDIMNGKLRRFSRERLERYLNTLGMEIRVQVYPRPAGKKRAGVSVQWLDGAGKRRRPRHRGAA